MLSLHQIVNRHNLKIAKGFIEDDVATLAFEVDTNDDVFNLKLNNA